MKKLLSIITILISSSALAAHKDSANVQIAQISAWGSSGDILIQTNPKHSIQGLGCEGDYWLKLRKTDEGYQAMLSMLIAAQAAKRPVLVRAIDDAGTDFCRLDRVILFQ